MESSQYVVGFLFRRNNTEVALIRKNKPDWQRGKLNGIGGKIEDGETPAYAMAREFEEETGAFVLGWERFCVLVYPNARIHFFKLSPDIVPGLKTTTDEEVLWYPVRDVLHPPGELIPGLLVIPNLRWLIPLALDETNLFGELVGQ